MLRSPLLILAICALVNSPHQAQTYLDIGAGAGVSFVRQSVSPSGGIDFGTRPAFIYGGLLSYDISSKLAIRIEPMWAASGANVDSAGFNFFALDNRYFDFPILLRYNVAETAWKPFLIGGSNVGFLQKAKLLDVFGEEVADRKDITRSIDVGLILGAGVQIPSGKTSAIIFEFYVNPGILDVDTRSGSTTFDVKNFSIQVRSFVLFRKIVKAGI